jgi:hypothetical protein
VKEPEPPKPIGGIYDDDTLDHTDPLNLNCKTPERVALKED